MRASRGLSVRQSVVMYKVSSSIHASSLHKKNIRRRSAEDAVRRNLRRVSRRSVAVVAAAAASSGLAYRIAPPTDVHITAVNQPECLPGSCRPPGTCLLGVNPIDRWIAGAPVRSRADDDRTGRMQQLTPAHHLGREKWTVYTAPYVMLRGWSCALLGKSDLTTLCLRVHVSPAIVQRH